ncbi:hypothetical protein ACHQM5_005017 [Ranunculus cassubicifolius]
MDNKHSSEFLGPKRIFEEPREEFLELRTPEMGRDEIAKMVQDIIRVSDEEAEEAKREYEKELRETEIESRKIRNMTLEEMLVYFNVIKPLKKRENPLTNAELSSKLNMMLKLEFISSCERELAKTRNHMERAESEEDAPLMFDQRRKECLDPEEVHKKYLDICRRMQEVNANMVFNGPVKMCLGPVEID